MTDIRSQSNTFAVKWPKPGTIEIPAEVDFVYIMRKDSDAALGSIVDRISKDYGADPGKTRQVLLEEYDRFVAELVETFEWGFSSLGNVEIHLFDHKVLDELVRAKSQPDPIISLDPLMRIGIQTFESSRSYYPGGITNSGQVASPGARSLSKQAQNIKSALGDTAASVTEDDIFSGQSIVASLATLLDTGIAISKVVPAIQVGSSKKLASLGIQVEPVVHYEAVDGRDILEKSNLGDPRDFLIGVSGLVIDRANGKYGRSPYVLPFVSPSARAGVPQDVEAEFSSKLLLVNRQFFTRVEARLGQPILLHHMDPHFAEMVQEQFGLGRNTPMIRVTDWALSNMSTIWESVKKSAELQKELARLELPKNMVFVDVNGTLFSDESQDGYIPAEDLDMLRHAVADAAKRGLSVGLCSDSPLPQLKKLASQLGITGPIVAENGNLLHHNDKTLTVREFTDLDIYKQRVRTLAESSGFEQVGDVTAIEFGGNDPVVDDSWAFGANREASLTVFGPEELILTLGEKLEAQQGLSIDCSPEYRCFAIHPGDDFKRSKGETLGILARYGHSITMIGNSMSDWMDPSSGIRSTFVADPRITEEAMQYRPFISTKQYTKGVVDIINRTGTKGKHRTVSIDK